MAKLELEEKDQVAKKTEELPVPIGDESSMLELKRLEKHRIILNKKEKQREL